jgi:hypothetical protein
MIFKKYGIKFCYRLFKTLLSPFQEGLWLYCRQKVVQHHINKEMCSVSVAFPLFCSVPVHIWYKVDPATTYSMQLFVNY